MSIKKELSKSDRKVIKTNSNLNSAIPLVDFNGIMENNAASLNTSFKMKGTVPMDSASHQIM